MTASCYWAKTPVRFSHLKAYGRSPMHGKHARTAHADDPSYAMERGSAVDAIIYGHKKVIGFPGKVRKGKEYDAFAAAHEGYEILTMSEYEKARRMAEAVLSSPVAAPLLKGVTQETLYFRWMGLDCRSTPDTRGADFLTELKTAPSSDPSKFVWHARRMSYHAQLRFQEHACRQHGHRILDHWIVCVESEPPFPVTVFHVEPEALEEGEKLLILWAERLKACEAANNYPPYVECPVPLVWPKDEFDLEYEEAA